MTHAAVAQQVKRLETWFETSLLERAGRGVAPTEDGRQLAEGLGDGFASISAAVRRLAERSADRPLRITTTPSFAAHWLIPNLADFRNANPDVELVIDPDARVVDMAKVDYDIGIRFGRGRWPGLEAMRLVTSDPVVAAATSLVEGCDVREARDLLRFPWLQEQGSDEWRIWLEANGLTDVQHSRTIHMPGSLAIDGIRRGLGVGLVARTWLEADIEAGRVTVLFEEAQGLDLGYYVVTRPGPHRPVLKTFLAWLARRARCAPGV